MANKYRYTFTDAEESAGGLLAAKLALVSLLLFVVSAFISFLQEGGAGAYIGAISLTAMALSVYGFYVGMKSFNEKDVSPRYSIIGSIACGVIMVGWLTLLLIGIG
ncbi:MAG: hypothetical protein Q4B09_05720 [Lachnospiraceae bacterium]|nr:hypothetical protein [Lachnospiraceae bacterium]